jgi:hypothetical protein
MSGDGLSCVAFGLAELPALTGSQVRLHHAAKPLVGAPVRGQPPVHVPLHAAFLADRAGVDDSHQPVERSEQVVPGLVVGGDLAADVLVGDLLGGGGELDQCPVGLRKAGCGWCGSTPGR